MRGGLLLGSSSLSLGVGFALGVYCIVLVQRVRRMWLSCFGVEVVGAAGYGLAVEGHTVAFEEQEPGRPAVVDSVERQEVLAGWAVFERRVQKYIAAVA